jgi:hypothetical protein
MLSITNVLGLGVEALKHRVGAQLMHDEETI